jgi:hypothetical protein
VIWGMRGYVRVCMCLCFSFVDYVVSQICLVNNYIHSSCYILSNYYIHSGYYMHSGYDMHFSYDMHSSYTHHSSLLITRFLLRQQLYEATLPIKITSYQSDAVNRELAATLESVFPQSALNAFNLMSPDEKVCC